MAKSYKKEFKKLNPEIKIQNSGISFEFLEFYPYFNKIKRRYSKTPAPMSQSPKPFCIMCRNTPSTIKIVGEVVAITSTDACIISPPFLCKWEN